MTTIQSSRFLVPSMSCGSCKRHILQALSPLGGVREIEVLLDRRELIVIHDAAATSPEDLQQTLKAAHYPAELLSADPA